MYLSLSGSPGFIADRYRDDQAARSLEVDVLRQELAHKGEKGCRILLRDLLQVLNPPGVLQCHLDHDLKLSPDLVNRSLRPTLAGVRRSYSFAPPHSVPTQ